MRLNYQNRYVREIGTYTVAYCRQQEPGKKHEYYSDGIVVPRAAADYFMEYGIREPLPLKKLREAGVESKIDLRLQPAITTLDELIDAGESGSYDMVFIDADKTGYDQYYEKSLQLLRSGGLLVIDNALWKLQVCDSEMVASDEDTRAIHNLNMKVQKDSRVDMCLISVADGLNIAMKL